MSVCGWILRTFSTRSKPVLLNLFKSLVIPHLDYGSQLWSPFQVKSINSPERVQRVFTKHIDGMHSCLLYREIKNNQDQIDMQRDLDALMDRESTWGMKFNAKKCNIMRVSRSRKPLQHFYSLGNEILQEVSDAKYLGIQIDNKLDWNKHILTVAARGQSKLAFLNRNLKGCPKKLRDTAYISLIRPALEYSCSAWHPHKKK